MFCLATARVWGPEHRPSSDDVRGTTMQEYDSIPVIVDTIIRNGMYDDANTFIPYTFRRSIFADTSSFSDDDWQEIERLLVTTFRDQVRKGIAIVRGTSVEP